MHEARAKQARGARMTTSVILTARTGKALPHGHQVVDCWAFKEAELQLL